MPLDMTELLASLTPAQRLAVEHVEGPLLVFCGPNDIVTHSAKRQSQV